MAFLFRFFSLAAVVFFFFSLALPLQGMVLCLVRLRAGALRWWRRYTPPPPPQTFPVFFVTFFLSIFNFVTFPLCVFFFFFFFVLSFFSMVKTAPVKEDGTHVVELLVAPVFVRYFLRSVSLRSSFLCLFSVCLSFFFLYTDTARRFLL